MKKLQKKYSRIDKEVVSYIFNIVCGSNVGIATETLANISNNEVNQIKQMIKAQKAPPKKEKPKKKAPTSAAMYIADSFEKLTLEKVMYNIQISDYSSEFECTQYFTNKSENTVELIYQFPVLTESEENLTTIHSVIVDLINPKTDEKKTLIGKVVPREKGEERYDDGISSGKTVMLLEKTEKNSNFVKLNLGGVSPQVKIVVHVHCVQELKMEMIDDDEIEEEDVGNVIMLNCLLPSSLNVKEVEGEKVMEKGTSGKVIENMHVDCSVDIKNGKVLEVSSPSHNEAFGFIDDCYKTKHYVSTAGDFVIRIKVSKYPLFSCVFQENIEGIIVKKEEKIEIKEETKEESKEEEKKVDEKDEKEKKKEKAKELSKFPYSTMLSIIPQNTSEDHFVCSEMIIIVDCSGSMAGSRMIYAKSAMRLFLQSLDPSDRIKINIIRFGSSYEYLYNTARNLDDKVLDEAMQYINKTDSNLRQTDILSPIRHVLRQSVSSGYSRQIFLLTDGEDENCLRICSLVKKKAQGTRIFSFGIGGEINEYFIREVARSSGGRACFLKKSEDIKRKVLSQLEYAIQPSIRNVNIEFPESYGEVRKVVDNIPVIYCNQMFVCYHFVENWAMGDKIKISYCIGESEKKTEHLIDPVLLKKKSTTLSLGILGATRKINEIQKYGKDKVKDKKEILSLGLKYNLLTSETSFIVVSSKEEEQKGEMKTQEVPLVPYLESNDNEMNSKHYMQYSGGQERYKSLAPMDSRSRNIRRFISPMISSFQPQQKQQSYLDRGERLERLVEQSDDLEEDSKSFMLSAKKSSGGGLFSVIGSALGSMWKNVTKKKKSDVDDDVREYSRSRSRSSSKGRRGKKAKKKTSSRNRSRSRSRSRSSEASDASDTGSSDEEDNKTSVMKSGSSDRSHEWMYEMSSDKEIKKQEQQEEMIKDNLKIFEKKLDNLKSMAMSMGDEIESGNRVIEDIDSKVMKNSESIVRSGPKNETVSTIVDSKKSGKGKRKISLKEKLSKVSGTNFEKLLFAQNVDGLWKFDKLIAPLIGVQFKVITENNPLKEEELFDYWMTALVIAYLQVKQKEKKFEWKLIAKKGLKILKKKKLMHLLPTAKKVIG